MEIQAHQVIAGYSEDKTEFYMVEDGELVRYKLLEEADGDLRGIVDRDVMGSMEGSDDSSSKMQEQFDPKTADEEVEYSDDVDIDEE